MTYIADRDALADAILAATWPDGDTAGFPTARVARMIADALIASGAVTDAATLDADLRAMGEVWGGDSRWLTTGTEVADLMAETVAHALTEREG